MAKTRTPRKQYEKRCEFCGRHFFAFRKNARFCKDQHRVKAAQRRLNRNERETTLAKFGRTCVGCGASESSRFYVRDDPRRGEKVVLCSKCNSALSRWLFYRRVPAPGKGYAKRAYQGKRIAEEQADAERRPRTL